MGSFVPRVCESDSAPFLVEDRSNRTSDKVGHKALELES